MRFPDRGSFFNVFHEIFIKKQMEGRKSMKKLITAAAMLAAMGALTFSAYADTTVYVTIADDEGRLSVADRAVNVSDADGDGALTINDTLIAAHEMFYSQGAAGGYEAVEGDYGLSVSKLWGVENGGSYGYYLNNASAWSLTDPVNDGDHLNAFIYTDLTAWSDTYCYFDKFDATTDSGDITLTLSAASFDADWNPITVPVEGADITVNGEKVGAKTDADGKVSLKFTGSGDYLISAVSETQTLVPPVCKVNVSLASASVEADTVTTAAAADTKGNPDTGVADVAVIAGIAILASGAVVLSGKRK